MVRWSVGHATKDIKNYIYIQVSWFHFLSFLFFLSAKYQCPASARQPPVLRIRGYYDRENFVVNICRLIFSLHLLIWNFHQSEGGGGRTILLELTKISYNIDLCLPQKINLIQFLKSAGSLNLTTIWQFIFSKKKHPSGFLFSAQSRLPSPAK